MPNVILLCRCANAEVLNPATRERVLRWAEGSSCAVAVVDDLCGAAARRDAVLKGISAGEKLIVAACHARAVRWLLEFAGVPVSPEKLTVLDMRDRPAEEIVERLRAFASEQAAAPQSASNASSDSAASAPADSWIPWYPVIDYDRCVNCRQCLAFCLFGVYQLDEEGLVRVKDPARCKTNCPACARTCPQVAIVFPKYHEGPISGQPVTSEDLSRSDLRVKPARQRQDIEQALRQRGRRDAETR